MNVSRVFSWLLACLLAATHAGRLEALEVKKVSVHLLLSPSGAFSDDITEMKEFGSWNFIPFMKDVPEGERFDSFLVKVRIASPVEVFRKYGGRIEIRSKNRRQLLVSETLRNIYVGVKGEAVTAMFVRGHVCEPLIVTVVVEKSRVTRELPFECGE